MAREAMGPARSGCPAQSEHQLTCRRVRIAALTVISLLCLLSSYYYFAVVVPPAAAATGRGIKANSDVFPVWLAVQDVLHGRNPYSGQAKAAVESFVYNGLPARESWQFPYPLYSILIFSPLALLSFEASAKLALFVFLLATAVAVRCWLDSWTYFVPSLLLVIGSFPFLWALKAGNATLLVLGLLSVAVWAARTGSYTLAGLTLALSTFKPNLAIAAVLPMMVWAMCSFTIRKRLAGCFCATLAGLLLLSETMMPGWIPFWLDSLRAYPQRDTTPLLTSQLVHGDAAKATTSLVCFVLVSLFVTVVAWVLRKGDPSLAVCFSISLFQLVIPFRGYNQVFLVAPILWLALNRAHIRSAGWPSALCVAAVWINLALYYCLNMLAGLLYLWKQALDANIGLLPVTRIFALPYITALTLSVHLCNLYLARRKGMQSGETWIGPQP